MYLHVTLPMNAAIISIKKTLVLNDDVHVHVYSVFFLFVFFLGGGGSTFKSTMRVRHTV